MSKEHACEFITIGKYNIEFDEYGKLWIEDNGEGGEFDEAELEKVIDTFYKENF